MTIEMFATRSIKSTSVTAIVILLVLMTANMATAETAQVTPSDQRPVSTLADINQAFIDIAEEVRPTVVMVSTERIVTMPQGHPFMPFGDDEFFDFFFGPDRRQRQQPEREFRQYGLGSGVIVDEQGHILTNNHVIENADTIFVRTDDGTRYTAEVIGADPQTDVAVIKIEADNLKFIQIGNSDDLRVGEFVLAVGSPMSQNLASTVTQGIVSAVGRSNVGLANYENFIQTDAAINMGNSGGPLVNLNGELIGLNTAILSRSGGFQGIGFAVPSNMAMRIMNSLLTEGRVVRGWLGVSIQDITQNLAEAMNLERTTGALIGDVLEDSPADKAGFESGDVIISMDNIEIRNSSHLRNQVAATLPDTKVTFEVIRGGRTVQIDAVLGERDAEIAQTGSDSNLEDKLGFAFETLTEDLADKIGVSKNLSGVAVRDIQPGSSAFRAGLRDGDVIREVDRGQVDNESEFIEAVKDKEAGDNILLRVHRQGNTIYLAFTL
ncbi:MAG: Do family serine endopeptidase [candidate division Zixibacteria bacterium]|nr:Do family serine endopeptidase [candidate division Zixibacteria bacterium]